MIDWKTRVTVSELAARIGGTSARLRAGDTLTVEDLMYGMMLPSGNDAALVLAETIGDFLCDCEEATSQGFISCFVREMNAFAHKLECHSTRY